MPRFKITGSFSIVLEADDDDKARDALARYIEIAEGQEQSFDYEVDSVEEEEEFERCEQCSKKVSSTELEQNGGICYVCANPNEFAMS